MGRVAVRVPIIVNVLPCVLDLTFAIDALARLNIHITLVAWSPLLARNLPYRTLWTIVTGRAECTEVLASLLIHLEERVLGAKLTLARAWLAVTQPARVTLGQPVAVTPTNCDLLDLSLEELREG